MGIGKSKPHKRTPTSANNAWAYRWKGRDYFFRRFGASALADGALAGARFLRPVGAAAGASAAELDCGPALAEGALPFAKRPSKSSPEPNMPRMGHCDSDKLWSAKWSRHKDCNTCMAAPRCECAVHVALMRLCGRRCPHHAPAFQARQMLAPGGRSNLASVCSIAPFGTRCKYL